MIGIGRRRTHRALAKAELNSGLGHLAKAANHAASGVGATVGPRVEAARDRVAPVAGKARKSASRGWGSTVTALAPLVASATDGVRDAGTAAKKAKLKANAKDAAKQAKKQAKKNAKRNRGGGSTFGKLLLAGAVVGAAGAAVARSRRARQDWEAYDPTSPVATAAERDTAPIPPTSAEKTTAAVTTSTATAAGTTREHAAKPETANPVSGSTPPATANVRPSQTPPAGTAKSANTNGGRS